MLGFCVVSVLIGCIIGGVFGGYCSNCFGCCDLFKIVVVLFFIFGVGFVWLEFGFIFINLDNIVFVYLVGYVLEFVIYCIIGGIGVGLVLMFLLMYIVELVLVYICGKLVFFN